MKAKVSVKGLVIALVMACSGAAIAQTQNQVPAPTCDALKATIDGGPQISFVSGESCAGFSDGNTSEALPYSLLGYAWQYAYKDDNATPGSTTQASGLFDGMASGDNTVAISFDVGISGPAMLGLKIGNDVGYYLFGGGFDAGDLLKFTWNPGWTGDGLSHTTLYTMAPIPEPGTYALMLAGLGAVTFVARRRKLSGR